MSRSKNGKSTRSLKTAASQHDGERRGRHQQRRQSRQRAGGVSRVTIYGLHAVAAALANPNREILHLVVTENAANTLSEAIRKRGVHPEVTNGQSLSRQLGSDAVHQGAAVKTRLLEEPGLETLLPTEAGPAPRVLVLDQVTDPHNVGAIIRSAAVFGAAGLVMTRRNSAPLSGVTAKAASGGLEHVPVILVNNLAQGLRDLIRAGYRIVGLDGDGPEILSGDHARGPTALVLGAEGTGLRRLTRETCDEICRLPTAGPLTSLNVSNAAAVALALMLPSS